ncbi:UDP-3-O-acyl-N-acetylglucosamine deacetylase [Candidatus Tachikawaea gelatinosa]|uniref:UDP-3-O-acyl-N-acetylglucosamine deacetylase n=1 Tax=Candidatus Tachikawaea gelatinosa TaxID=1410383 RepID=A0A090BWE3_9ENTR|nr:UDP-3-O-acyl-N-acetylglucosamine deacetylase [Candidatus Tachikawaea gelatinosa]BAP58456.1 UDP-3-O-[3-hydroxymyristoyl] N-acetylglucosamine deacetylase [Candidatus Tachikawaea gelatinosa]
MFKQRTLKRIIKIYGIGLHTGKKTKMFLKPAIENTGIIYRRIDMVPFINLEETSITNSTELNTCLTNKKGIYIFTIEHLNAAFSCLGIDNVIVEIDGLEIPIMDGSAMPFIKLLIKAGIQELNTAKKFILVKKKIRVEEKDKWAEIKPYKGFFVDFTVDFNIKDTNFLLKQRYQMIFSTKLFIKKIACARTFGFMYNVDLFKKKGLCLGGNLNCSIVIDKFGKVVNKRGLRFKNEYVCHKILDTVGDLFTCGYNIVGAFSGFKSGHKLNNKLIKCFLTDQNSWEFITLKKNDDVSLKFKIPIYKK